VVHCAASVSFDDSYENSFRANVLGCRNALGFSLSVQRTPGSPFIAHLAIETSYIHGRRKRAIAQEGLLEFPPHFYNNFYELTKAMASIETDRALVADGLRVMQLLPSIVIGDSRTGNNRGDTKVVNAPINAFGRAKEALSGLKHETPADRVKVRVISWLATSFPADPSAELNLVPVDRVAAGILAALTTPAAIGARIHLATDNRIKSEDILKITREELGGQREARRPHARAQRHAADREGGADALRRAQAGRRARAAGRDLQRLRRVGPADPRRRQRRAAAGAADPAAGHAAGVPDAVPPQ
jgi:nucleoside-diphosphate-sugar epimerase